MKRVQTLSSFGNGLEIGLSEAQAVWLWGSGRSSSSVSSSLSKKNGTHANNRPLGEPEVQQGS